MDVAAMFEELNDHGFTDTGSVRKLGMLNDALYDAASREAWPHLETTIVLTFDGSSEVPTNLPADVRTIMSVVDVDSRTKLEWERLDVMEGQGHDLTASGNPSHYYQIGNQLHVWPVPPSSTTLRVRYIRIPAAMTAETLSADVDWPLSHHRILVLGGLNRLYDMEDDPELAVRYQQHYEQRLATMAQDVFARQSDRPDRIYTDPWFDGDLD